MGALTVSLINKILLDLDGRTPAEGKEADDKSVFAHLQPVGASSPSRAKRTATFIIAMTLFSAAGGAGYYYYFQHGKGSIPSTVSAAHAVTPVTKPGAPPALATPQFQASPHAITPIVDTADASVVTASPPPVVQNTPSMIAEPPPTAVTQKTVSAVVAEKHVSVAISTEKNSMPVPGLDSNSSAITAPRDETRLERIERPLSPAENAENLYREGMAAFRLGRAQEGEQTLFAALTADRTHIAARDALSVVLLESQRYEEAKKLLSDGMDFLPTYVPFAYRLARVYVDRGDEAAALALLEDHRTRTSPDADYLGLLATLYQRAGRHSDSRDAYQQALALRGDEGRWWMGLGISLEALQDWTAARDAYQRSALNTRTESRARQFAEQRLAAINRRLIK